MSINPTHKKIEELDASILSIMNTLYQLTQQVKDTKEDVELTNKLMETLRAYLYTVVRNFRQLEENLEKAHIETARWKAYTFTLATGYGIFILLVIFAMYA